MNKGTVFLLAVSGLMSASPSQMEAQTPAIADTRANSAAIRSDQTEGQIHSTWQDYAGASDASQYSSLAQINRDNVSKLQVVWNYPTGDGNKYLFNPIVVDRMMYVLARNNSIVALDATTGKELWTHPSSPKTTLITNRGINYWESADRSERRLLFAANNFLEAIDARTGQSIPEFGENGRVDLRKDLGRDPESLTLVQSSTPGRVFEDLLILGSATNEEYESGPGDIRAFNVRTGRLVWIFHTVPRPGEFGYETWPKDAWKTVGGANAWSGLSVDVKRGIVFVPTASPKYNFYGADRTGTNLFGDCLIALNARTGKLIWYFQMVHHDIWDYDNATSPMLLTVRHEGKLVDVVAQSGKEGFVWVFNRETGEPLWPIEERAVPRSDMPGETSAVRAAKLHRQRSEPVYRARRAAATGQTNGSRSQPGAFHSAGRNRYGGNAGEQWRSKFPGCSRGSRTRNFICCLERPSFDAQTGTESSGAIARKQFSRGKGTCGFSIQLHVVPWCKPRRPAACRARSDRCRIATILRSDSWGCNSRTRSNAGFS
jgi:glucose dehydrogenase